MKDGQVFLNIEKSTIKYDCKGFTFYFSSNFYKEKFKKTFQDFIDNEINKMNVRFKTLCLFEEYFLVVYYKKIEKRGFRVYDKVNKCYLTQQVVFNNTILKY